MAGTMTISDTERTTQEIGGSILGTRRTPEIAFDTRSPTDATQRQRVGLREQLAPVENALSGVVFNLGNSKHIIKPGGGWVGVVHGEPSTQRSVDG